MKAIHTETNITPSFQSKFPRLDYELNDIPSEIINSNTYEDIKRKLNDIADDIESVGKICDSQMKSSFEQFKSVLDKEDSELDNQIQFCINDLRNEIIRKKTETIPKYKGVYCDIKKKVTKIVKEVNQSEKEHLKLNNKHNLLLEDDVFSSSQIANAKELNVFLKYKIKTMTENKDACLNKQNEGNVTMRMSTMDTPKPHDKSEQKQVLLTSMETVKQLSKWFDLNEKSIAKKLIENKKQLLKQLSKYESLFIVSDNTYMGLFKTMINRHLSKKNDSQKRYLLPNILNGNSNGYSNNYSFKNNRYNNAQTEGNVSNSLIINSCFFHI